MTDNNEHDDLNNLDVEGGEATTAQRGFTANLSEAWRTKPLFKLLVIVVAVGGVVAVATSFLTPEKESSASARVMTPPDIKSAPGGSVSPYMKAQTDLANKQRTEGALKNGGSALPTPQGRVADLGDLEKKNDPLSELRTETEHLKQELIQVQQTQKQPTPAPQPQAQPQKQADNDQLAQVMSKQMTLLAERWRTRGNIKDVLVSNVPTDRNGNPISSSSASGAGVVDASGTAPGAQSAKIVVPAGTVSYAQLLTEANSDVPGPILAQIVSGPLAGARAVGSFQVKNDYLVLQFNLANLKNKDYSISALALDPDTTLGGMATEIDNRYFTRVVLPSAAAFLEGLGEALGTPPSTTTTTTSGTVTSQGTVGAKIGMYKGLGKAAETAGSFFKAEGDKTKELVRIASGTPMGLFFTSSVKEPTTAGQNNRTQYQGNYQGGQQGGYQGGYQGTTVSGYGGQQAVGVDTTANTGAYNTPSSGAYGANGGFNPTFQGAPVNNIVPATNNSSTGYNSR